MTNKGAIVITGPNIHRARFITMVKGLELELQGMRLARGRTCYAMLKEELGLKGSRIKVLEQCRKIAEQMKN